MSSLKLPPLDTATILSLEVEAKLLGDCYALLLDDIRRNRARRLARPSKSTPNNLNGPSSITSSI